MAGTGPGPSAAVPPTSANAELSAFRVLPSVPNDKGFNLLRWWQERKERFPRLSVLFRSCIGARPTVLLLTQCLQKKSSHDPACPAAAKKNPAQPLAGGRGEKKILHRAWPAPLAARPP